jgi:uncharacterized membrane protein
MAFDNAQFRLDFLEFGDTTAYTDAVITFWSGIAVLRLDSVRWGTFYTHGLELLTAHYVALARADQLAAAAGGIGGNSTGAISSQSADDVSVSFDSAAGTEKDAGQFNLTTYGRQFIQLARIVGGGGVQL